MGRGTRTEELTAPAKLRSPRAAAEPLDWTVRLDAGVSYRVRDEDDYGPVRQWSAGPVADWGLNLNSDAVHSLIGWHLEGSRPGDAALTFQAPHPIRLWRGAGRDRPVDGDPVAASHTEDTAYAYADVHPQPYLLTLDVPAGARGAYLPALAYRPELQETMREVNAGDLDYDFDANDEFVLAADQGTWEELSREERDGRIHVHLRLRLAR